MTTSKNTNKPKAAPKKKAVPKKKKAAPKKKAASKKTTTTTTTTTTTPTSTTTEPVVEVKLEATKESGLGYFDKLVADVTQEISTLRENKIKGERVRNLRTLVKNLKSLKGKTSRVIGKKTTKRRSNGNSGFLKPVGISKEMAEFTGWVQAELKSRVDVTKFICNYIKDNNLQNPSDRRQINADKKLTKLLRIKKGDPPLTYYRIQSYMKPHFTSV